MAHPYAKAAPQNFAPTLSDLLSDDDLRDLAKPDHYRDRGELSPEHQQLLAMVLPELCGTILAQRAALIADPVPPRRAPPNAPDALFHHHLCQRARARNLADRLRAEHAPGRAALIRTMVAVNGGSLTDPRIHDTSDPHRFELRLLGIAASGDTLDTCLDEWIKAATRCAPAPDTSPDDPVPIPAAMPELDQSTAQELHG